ncbi:MAG: hypothetical protein E6R04_03235 [Spirochaetes bacterium]|nr:MAG: hypothetical protein E6R04_03235 [Spirochaetota bacterium]
MIKQHYKKVILVTLLCVASFSAGKFFSHPARVEEKSKAEAKHEEKKNIARVIVRDKVTLPSGEIREHEEEKLDVKSESKDEAKVEKLKLTSYEAPRNFIFGGLSQRGSWGAGYSRRVLGPVELGVFVSRYQREVLATGFVGLRF